MALIMLMPHCVPPLLIAASTPFLELYVTLERTKEELNKYILEEPVEGFPLVAAVLFQEGDEGDEGQQSGTTVTLRLSYLLPSELNASCSLPWWPEEWSCVP